MRKWGTAPAASALAVAVSLAAWLLLLVPAEALARAAAAPLALAELPSSAQATYLRIRRGGPFHHAQDGAVFANRERQLPNAGRGYYREYTVPTPGAADRGARRIVCGGASATEPDLCYYTADHYASFRPIAR